MLAVNQIFLEVFSWKTAHVHPVIQIQSDRHFLAMKFERNKWGIRLVMLG